MHEPPPPSPSPRPTDPGFEALLIEALDRLERGGAAALEQLLAAHPDAAPKLRAHLERLQRHGLAGERSTEPPVAPPERLGEFRILAPLGHGGMGVVYRAVQESLGREVALKLIRPDQLWFPGARERFRREVELVARMQHPGIVPVFAVGNDGGVPYFAMELVRGVSLATVIERFAGRNPAALRGTDLDALLAAAEDQGEAGNGGAGPRSIAALFEGDWTTVVLRIVREVAEAIEHAHRRGVLHRDVKPSNVMLTRSGRVLLLDFGLAGGDGSERMTKTGSALGSLAYMPPEVLAGAGAGRDARGDVYSLGVTAWELLALQLPYQSSDPAVLRQLAGAARRPRLRTHLPGIAWEVETVLATAMEPEPQRRYASASALSQDLDAVLQHRPIAARDAGPWLRLRRWTQRHPARAVTLLAALLIAIGGPLAWAAQEASARGRIEAERDRLATSNRALDLARTRAQANFAKLQQAVDTMLTRVGDQSLRDVPRMEGVRQELLGAAVRFYEGFLVDQPDDPALRRDTAMVRARLAEVQALLGDYAAAQTQVTAAIAGLDGTDDPAQQRMLARARTRQVTARRLLGDLPGATAAAAAAVASWQALTGQPEPHEIARGLGEARLEQSLLAVDSGDLPAGITALEQSLAELLAAPPSFTPHLQHLIARSQDRLGVWLFQRAMQVRDKGMLERAVVLHEQAAVVWTSVLAKSADTQIRADAAQNRVSIAMPLRLLGRKDEALAALAAGVAAAEALVADYPRASRRRADLANARGNYAAMLGMLDRLADSRQQAVLAQELWQQLLRESPTNDDYAIGLAQASQGLAAGTWLGGDPEGAVPLLQQALDAAEQALVVRPDNPTYRRARRKIGETIASLQLARNDHAAAAAAARTLLEPRLAPTEPVLAAALLARAIPVAMAGADDDGRGAAAAAALRTEALELLRAAIAAGSDPAQWRKDITLSDQWSHASFTELVDAVQAETKQQRPAGR
ncbi:MAG: serine/threonine protein kinase [Planctomycetes bacterium]|jgi:hypothetical protein|nr:serine/threonine protein kinase [Planctomycetota bacterium]